MTYVPKRWHRNALLTWALLTLVGGPLVLLGGVSLLDRGTPLITIGGWFMVVGGVLMVLGGGMTLLRLPRWTPRSASRRSPPTA